MLVGRYSLSVAFRGVRAFLNLDAGIVGEGAADGRTLDQAQEIERLRKLVAEKDGELAERRTKPTGAGEWDVVPENMVWIFGDGRTGSTWLMRMVEELPGQTLWREPMVGLLFGYLYYFWADEKRYKTRHFVLGRERESWLRSIREFVLGEASSRFPDLADGGYLVVKEPNGSIGAPLLSKALPESRMILLVRDPRDVVASALDAHKKGGWHHERMEMQESLADMNPDAFVEKRAYKYLWYVGNSKLAYDAHGGPKALVRYEELRADPLGTLRRIYSDLGIPVEESDLARAVEKHSWDNVPEEKKGEGKFFRRGTPGGWREDLTAEQAGTVERVTAPLLKDFYSYAGPARPLADELASSQGRMRMMYSP